MAIGTANPFNGTQLWKMTSPVKTVEPTTPTDPEKPKPTEPEKPNPSEPEKPSDTNQPNITVKPSDTDKTGTTVTTKTDDKKGTTKTGDSTDIATSVAATIGSLALLVGCAFVLRKKKVRA